MGKRTTGRAKGKGSFTFQVRKKAYVYKISYPRLDNQGKAKIVKLFHSAAHSAPLVKIRLGKEDFYSPAANETYEGQEIEVGGNKIIPGNILKLKDIPQGTNIFNIESVAGKGGKYLRSSGCSAIIGIKDNRTVEVIIRRRRIRIDENCRATIGVVAGDGRLTKPLTKAGKQFFRMRARGRKWHRTSPIKTNAVDHPFGSGRGKRIKSKIAKRNAPPGAKVGHIRPSRTGHIK